MMEYGLQLYSVRDITEKDLPGAIRSVSKLGYKGMEFAGFFGFSAEQVLDVMKECGVSAWGTHTGPAALEKDRIAETVRYHHAIGCDRLIMPGADLTTREKLEAFAKLVRSAGAYLAEEGITLGYHNHSHEFRPNEDGIVIYDWLLENTDLKLQLDTYWAYNAGKDPIQMLKDLGSRVICIHIKDGLMGGEGRALGEGTAPVRAVHDYAAANRLPMIVESEGLQPTGLKEVGRCMDYLRQLG